jgi:hypothetical protein
MKYSKTIILNESLGKLPAMPGVLKNTKTNKEKLPKVLKNKSPKGGISFDYKLIFLQKYEAETCRRILSLLQITESTKKLIKISVF